MAAPIPPNDANAQASHTQIRVRTIWPEYLTTEDAAAYMRRSVSWMLHQKDIPYYRGNRNPTGDMDSFPRLHGNETFRIILHRVAGHRLR